MYILTDYIIWWYSKGIITLFKYLKSFLIILTDTFSVKLILTTFFKPWKKDATPTGGLSIDQRLRVMVFNLISIVFGMVIKSVVFLVYLIVIIIIIPIELITFFIWILSPFIIIELLVFGLLYLIR